GNLLEANESYANMLGYSVSELLNMNIMEINDRFNKENLDIESELLKANVFSKYYTKHKHKSGKQIDVEISVKFNKFIDNGVFFVFINDISDRIASNKKLEMMHENYQKFFNTIDEFLFVLDEQGIILYTNKAVIDRLEYSQEEIIGNSVLNLHAPEDRDEALRIVIGMLKGELAFCPLPLIKKNGIKIPVETRVTKGIWDGKNVIFGVSKDISLLKLSEEKFSKSFYINPVACGFSDISTGEYIEVNDAFCNLLGYDRSEVLGKTSNELGILDEETRYNILSKYKFDDKIINVEAKLTTKNGETKCVLLSAQNIYLFDRSLRFTAAYDITEIKKINEELKKINEELNRSKKIIEMALNENNIYVEELIVTKNKLEKINREKDRLFSVIAHDLKSPFQGFLGITELLATGLDDLSITELKDIFEETNKSAHRIFDLLNNLLEWAKIQRGLTGIEPVKLDISEIINYNIALFSRNLLDKNIDIKTELSSNVKVFADEKVLNTVIRNLLSNAIKFSFNNSQILIKSQKVENNFLEVSISDCGLGMPPELQDKLFVIGEKIGRRGTAGEESSGLGLALCKEFIELSNGKIWVESIENKGTTFYFTIPLYK
ncbi:MAG TPA: PAS domain S-box protein, partial [Melioribacteraceae bacterium]|nr:PAS domain S-box protein [Melioribacteraceae bacterium]